MNIVWSPEAIKDLISLRAYIANDTLAPREGPFFTSCATLNSCFQIIRRWGVLGASLALESSSSPIRHLSFPIDCRQTPYRYYVFFTERAAGRTVYSGGEAVV